MLAVVALIRIFVLSPLPRTHLKHSVQSTFLLQM